MIRRIGTKVYYCTLTGNVLHIVGDIAGYVQSTTFEEDVKIYPELQGRAKETIGLIQLKYGEYAELSFNSTGVRVDLETKQLDFSYDPLPVLPEEPSELDVITEKVNTLTIQNANLLLDNAKKEIQISDINTNLANVTLEVAKLKVGV